MTENEIKESKEWLQDFTRMYGCNFDDLETRSFNKIVTYLEELKQYRAIGTVEEFKALKEKSVAKKPKYQKIQYGKHKWKRKENGEIDDFAWDYAYCNGVVCEVCGETQCVHCNPKYDKLKDCEVEDYFCPTCNETVGYFYSHCKHCWQKLDWQ